MKKLIIFALFLTVMLGFSSTLGIEAAIVTEIYDVTVFDNFKYDLNTGQSEVNINYSITNKLSISTLTEDEEIDVSSMTFHHVLFYDRNNTYIGYINATNTTLQLSSYLGYDVINDIITYPENADKFALMIYNYDDTRDIVFHENPSIDDIAWDGVLTYRDIFGNSLYGIGSNNLFDNGDFTGVNNIWSNNGGINNIINEELVFTATSTGSSRGIFTDIINDVLVGDIIYLSYDFKTNDTSPVLFGLNDNRINVSIPSLNVYHTYSSYFEVIAATFITLYQSLDDTNITYYDNMLLYNLDIIFEQSPIPTIEQFENMLDFFILYLDAPEEITYNDVFENNLIINGSFTGNSIPWIPLLGDNGIYSNDTLLLIADASVVSSYQEVIANETDIIYVKGNIFKTSGTNALFYILPEGAVSGGIETLMDSTAFEAMEDGSNLDYSSIFSLTNDGFRVVFGRISSRTFNFNVDNVDGYNLTDIFGVGLEPDTTVFIEDLKLIWDDPLGESYSLYYPVASLLTLVISYDFDDTPAPDPDVTDGIEDGLISIGADNEELKLFLSLAIMIIFAIFVGLKTSNIIIVLLGEVVLFMVFALLGWVSFWIILLIALMGVLLVMYKIIRGGNVK